VSCAKLNCDVTSIKTAIIQFSQQYTCGQPLFNYFKTTYLRTNVQNTHSSTANALANRVVFCSIVATVVLPIFDEFVARNVLQHLLLSYEEEAAAVLFANAFWPRRV
jgi:hypothetical protein